MWVYKKKWVLRKRDSLTKVETYVNEFDDVEEALAKRWLATRQEEDEGGYTYSLQRVTVYVPEEEA